jgi:hypothetical protein
VIVRRTPSGETNKRLFLGVEAIVYVEGGQPLSPSQVRAGQYAREAMDIRFWESLFECFWQGGELEFRAIGCKDTLLSLADDIIEGRVANVVVAMDRDHDEFKCALKKTHNVLYTYAYSWEGDVWSRVVVSRYFTHWLRCRNPE